VRWCRQARVASAYPKVAGSAQVPEPRTIAMLMARPSYHRAWPLGGRVAARKRGAAGSLRRPHSSGVRAVVTQRSRVRARTGDRTSHAQGATSHSLHQLLHLFVQSRQNLRRFQSAKSAIVGTRGPGQIGPCQRLGRETTRADGDRHGAEPASTEALGADVELGNERRSLRLWRRR
jgi:hypothetical protein